MKIKKNLIEQTKKPLSVRYKDLMSQLVEIEKARARGEIVESPFDINLAEAQKRIDKVNRKSEKEIMKKIMLIAKMNQEPIESLPEFEVSPDYGHNHVRESLNILVKKINEIIRKRF